MKINFTMDQEILNTSKKENKLYKYIVNHIFIFLGAAGID